MYLFSPPRIFLFLQQDYLRKSCLVLLACCEFWCFADQSWQPKLQQLKKTNAFMFFLNNILLFLESKQCTAVLQLFKYFIFLKLVFVRNQIQSKMLPNRIDFLDLYVYDYLLIESKSKKFIKLLMIKCILSFSCRIMCMIILYPERLLVLYIDMYMVTI